MKIKIKIEYTSGVAYIRSRNILNYYKEFNKNNIVFVDENEKFDLVLLFAEGKKCEPFLEKYKKCNKPIIICERLDSSSSNILNKYGYHPNIIAIFKNYTLRPKELYLEPLVRNRYHYNVLIKYKYYQHKELLQPKDSSITKDILYKIHNVSWDITSSFLFSWYNKIRKLTIDFNKKRKLDVVCQVGLSNPGYYWLHRKKALAILEKMKHIKIITKHSGNYGRGLQIYYNNMLHSKICVSPWGWGEFAYRDYEAIYCGALLIKPTTDHVATFPDIYQSGKTYIACKPDFSDLEEIIENVLENYNDYKHIRENALQLLKKNNIHHIIKLMCDTIHSVWNDYQK